MDKLVSIIMPAYNAAAHIAEAINSVLNQSYSHWELCVIDDGSTDNTEEIVSSYCELDKRVTYIYQENSRQGRARNNGIEHTSGEYIAFLDSDDIWLPEKLAVQVQELDNTEAALLFSDSYVFASTFDLTSARNKLLPVMNTERGLFTGDKGLSFFLESNRIPILIVLLRRSALVEVGGFTEKPPIQNAEDYHLWLKLLLAGFTLVGLDSTLAAYRRHDSSVSDADGRNLRQAIEAKINLSSIHPEKSSFISQSIPRTILLSLGQVSKYKEVDFYNTIDYYLQLTNKNKLRPLFHCFRKAKMRGLALKSIHFVMNYL